MLGTKHFCGGLTPELKKRAERELGETEEIRKRSLIELKELLKVAGDPDFYPCTEDIFLLKFLRQQKFNVDKTFKMIKKYYWCKGRYSGIFTEMKIQDIKITLDECHATILEYRDQNDAAISVIRTAQYDIKKFTLEDLLGCLTICSDIALQEEATQVAGYAIIMDLTGLTLRQTIHYGTPSNMYKTVVSYQELIPCRVKAYHFVNEPPYFHYMYGIARNFMSAKLKKRVHFHGTNLSSLHKYISPDILPKELGGKQGSMSSSAKQFNSYILSHEDYINEMNKYGYRGKTLQKIKKELF